MKRRTHILIAMAASAMLLARCGGNGGSTSGKPGSDGGPTGDGGLDGSAADSGPDAGDAGAQPTLHKVSADDLHAWLQNKDFLLICVHIPDAGEIPGTDTHIPYNQVDDIATYIGSDPDRKVVIYCLTNHMSLIAGPELVSRGYRNIWYLDGGMSAWTAAGYDLAK